MRDNPNTMTAAIYSARQEFALQQRFQLRTGRDCFAPQSFRGEPMEIDHLDQNEINALSAGLSLNLDLSIKRCRQSKCDTTKKSFVGTAVRKVT